MIAVISDLHLQHTAHDVIRHRDGGRVLECGVRRNVGAGALKLLFAELSANVARSGAKQVELVLAGDIFELHRTPVWFAGGDSLRPFLPRPSESADLYVKVRGILEAIVAENHSFFATLARAVEDRTFVLSDGIEQAIGAPIVTHFIPGNHDRLANAWPELRARVRELLCMSGDPSAPFPHRIDRPEGYAVRIRHGHEYEASNFGARFEPGSEPSEEDYAAPALGDYVTIDMVTRLSVAFRAHYARELRSPGPDGELYRRLYLALTEFDDVRPATALPSYLADAVGPAGARGFAALRPILRDAFEAARRDRFFTEQGQRLGVGKYFSGPYAAALDAAIANLNPDWLPKLLAAMGGEGDTKDPPANFAAREPGLADGSIQVVIAGHTHKPDHVALPRAKERAGSFIDSGTWRTRIDQGVGGAFGRLRAYTMVFCYSQSERSGDERRQFETWTGHLATDEHGAYVGEELPAGPVTSVALEFTEIEIGRVDEGDTENGAELLLHFGVDADGLSLTLDGIHNGEVISLDPGEFRVRVDPALDAEIWCWGVERDLGDALFDRDDALPWAVDFLPRQGPEGALVPGTSGKLQVANATSSLTLSYRIANVKGS